MTIRIPPQDIFPLAMAGVTVPPGSALIAPCNSNHLESIVSSAQTVRQRALFQNPGLFLEHPHVGLMRIASVETVQQRLDFLRQQPKALVHIHSSSIHFQDLVYQGLPPGVGLPINPIIIPSAPMELFHYTEKDAAAAILSEGMFGAGAKAYIHALNAGSERIYSEYCDLTGIFFLDRTIAQHEGGNVGAASTATALRVIIPAGMPILKLRSHQATLPFYLLPMEAGDYIRLSAEEVE
jgi:hypothetical protein